MESKTSDEKYDENVLDSEKRCVVSNVNHTLMEMGVKIQNMQLMDCKNGNATLLEEIEDVDYIYSCIIRYLLLQTVMASTVPQRICARFRVLDNNKLSGVSEVINVIDLFFYDDFGEMCLSRGSELERAEFYLSRSVVLCGEPTYSNFLLVAAFVTHIFLHSVYVVPCIRTLFLCEFIFDVLYRRIFRKIFDVEGYKKLMSFCNDFNNSLTTESSLSDLENTKFGAKWISQVKNITNIVGDSFSLSKSEVEMFRKNYSTENNLEYKSQLSRKLECEEYFILKKNANDTLVCKFCDSKCYNYADHLKHFVSS
ncbi:hypothetical protein NPIL_549931 [Nephila pilipes]|uniref:Uncharacterized protein n=1 Tax=Nephila pilipes TaxID=299642 RepID=A0A8X6R543_NEPPI|nr:hypothetical protein NPIL_549931 [Nephila pilipes]